MTNLFFYGSLRDEALLRIVLGDDKAEIELIPARFPDHKTCWVKDQGFPMIVAAKDDEAEGLLAIGLGEDHIARLNFYEGGFDYDLRPQTVQTEKGDAHCEIYFPPEGKYQHAEPWLLTDWQRDWGPISREAASEAMSYFGQIDSQTLQQRFPMIRARASTRLRARASEVPTNVRTGMTAADVALETVTRSHAGFFALDVVSLRHKKFDGTSSDLLRREVFLGTDASIVLPYDPKQDKILLVEQFRMGPTGRHDPIPWALEPVAGLIDPGETPEQSAIREAEEEADIDIKSLEKVAQGYSSPGASSEYFFLYVGLCNLPDVPSGTTGKLDEGEDIRSHILSFDEAMTHVDTGEINIIPTLLCLNWLARHRDRLRASS